MDMLKELPKVLYNGYVGKNILAHAVIAEGVLNQFRVYHPYSVVDGERPDTIASDYYGSSEYAWLVMYCNQMLDPYFEWSLSHYEFQDMLKDKYGNNTTIKSTPMYYEYVGTTDTPVPEIARKDWTITPFTYQNYSIIEKAGWIPVTIYDDEFRKNEKRRNIKLISNTYIPQIDNEVKRLFS